MERAIKERSILDKFCIEFCNVLEKHTQYIIVSGFVAIASGRARGTEDIDCIISRLSAESFGKIHQALAHAGFAAIQSDDASELYRYLADNTSIRYTWKDRPLPEMNIKFAKDALDDYQLKTRQKLPLTGLHVWFSSVNMNIAFKEELLKSDKDIEDAKLLRMVYAENIDEDEINNIKTMIRNERL